MNQQIKILGIAPADELNALKDLLDCAEINCISTIPTDEHLIPNIVTLPFDGVVIYSPKMVGTDFRFTETLYMARKDITIILIYEEIDSKMYENAMYCGITKCLSAELDPDIICKEIVKEIKRSSSRKQQALVKNYESRVIAVFSAKGGAGKTTTAVNLSALLAKKKKTIIVDLDLQFGDVSTFLGMEKDEAMTVAELTEEKNITPNTIKQYIATSEYNLDIIPSPAFPEKALQIKIEKVKTVISMLRADYDYVVIDLPSSIDPTTLTMTDMADTIYYLVNPEAPSLSDAKACLDLFTKLGTNSKIKVIAAKTGTSFIREQDIADTLHTKVIACIPYDARTAVFASNMGIPLVLNDTASRISQAYIEMAENEFDLSFEEYKPKRHGLSFLSNLVKPKKPDKGEI